MKAENLIPSAPKGGNQGEANSIFLLRICDQLLWANVWISWKHIVVVILILLFWECVIEVLKTYCCGYIGILVLRMTFCLDKLFGFNSPILSIAEFWNQMRMERQKMEQHQPYQLFKSSWLFQLSTMTMSIFSCFLYLLFSLVFFFHVSDTCINLTPWTWENLIWGFPLGTGGARWDIREDVTEKKNLFGERLLYTHSHEGNVCSNVINLMGLIVYIWYFCFDTY